MRWIDRSAVNLRAGSRAGPPRGRKSAAILVFGLILLAAALPNEEKHISVYSNVATYTLPILDRDGREYVGLLEILEPLGRVSAGPEGRHFKLRFNDLDSEFEAGKTRAKIRGRAYDLPAPLLIENSRGLVPLDSLTTLLPRFLEMQVTFHENARRLFIGDTATHVQAELDSTNPPRLVLNFTSSVNPTIATEPGKLHMVFKRDPLVAPGAPGLIFDSEVITRAQYSENNGAAELTILGTAPLMASFSNNGRTIIITPAPRSESAAPPQIGLAPPASRAVTQPGFTVRRPIAVVDAAHGGDERGSAISDMVPEKNVTLGFARLLRHELEIRGFSVYMLRDSDVNLTLDQRAGAANVSNAAIYVSLHASSEGTGARVYTALLPAAGEAKGAFQPWNGAQARKLTASRSVATAVSSALEKANFPARTGAASLRPLNNLLMAAIAVELAPGPRGVSDLPSPNYQQKAAAAVADGIASVRDRLGAQP